MAAIVGISDPMLDDLRLREEAAQHELARRVQEIRAKGEGQEASTEPSWREAPGALPGAGSLAREITEGAFRLGFTLVSAPLRIALAVLRARERDERSEPGD